MKIARTTFASVMVAALALWVPGAASAAPEAGASGGKLTVACIDWFYTGGHRDHIHMEVHVEDAAGKGVIGAAVQFENSYDRHDGRGPFVYQKSSSTTSKTDGKNDGRGCTDPSGSGVTGIACCIGAGKWGGEIPGKRACPSGFYSTKIVSVTAPAGSNLVWDGKTPANGIEFFPGHA